MGLRSRFLILARHRLFFSVMWKSKVRLIWLVIGAMSMSACSSQRFPVSDHSDGSVFYNEDRSVNFDRGLLDMIKWKFSGEEEVWPDAVVDNVEPNFSKQLGQGEGAVTFINHATEFVQFEKFTVLTDPVFSERVSPFSWMGPKRHREPGASLAELPKIDVVIVSHNHFDHMDIDSLVAVEKKDQPIFIVPLGNKAFLEENGINHVVELDWWQSYSSDAGFDITLVPMQHWSARGIFDKFETLWGGYVVESSGLKVLFAGDTGYNKQFKEIEEKFGAMDLSLLPIGAYEPRWFMKDQHMNPEEAVQAHLDLRSKLSIGMHFGAFQLTDEGIEDPVTDLVKSLMSKNIDLKDFIVPKNGQTTFFESATPDVK